MTTLQSGQPVSTCARNLPQHFNGCSCTSAPGGPTAEATDVDLDTPTSPDEWLPPGAHKIVACERCAADEARANDPGCQWCENGRVTTDRYGQTPWHPNAPGTLVGYQSRRSGEDHKWVSATITASASPGESEFYALGLDADNEAVNVYLHSAIPLPAAQAAARHGVSKAEMIEEAAHDMHIGIAPSHDEVRAFLARIDGPYLEDLASAAARHRAYAALDLAAEGKTGPALDTSFDTSVLKPDALSDAIEGARKNFHTQFEVTGREHWHGYTIVYDEKHGFPQTYKDTAWDEPDEQPLLPWSPPTGTPIAHVALDGTVRRVDNPRSLR